MRNHKRCLHLLYLALCAVILAACVGPAAPTGSSTAANSTTADADRNTLQLAHRLGFGGAESLDPYARTRFLEATLNLYNRLIRPDEQGLPSPELATSWQSNADGTIWTVQLRKDVTFHDGSTFDAADVVYSFTRLLDPANKFPAAATLSMIERVEAGDATTVLFHLHTPYTDFPLLLMDYRARIIPEKSGDTIATTGIGTGPFKLEELDVKGITTLVANPTYWEGPPHIARIKIAAIVDGQAQAQALLSGQLDLAWTLPAQQAQFAGNPKLHIEQVPVVSEWSGLTMRTDTPPFNDVRVRKALRMAVDRQAMADLIEGKGVTKITCDDPVFPMDTYRADLTCPQDIEGAKALLAAAGYPKGITVDLYLPAEFADFAQVYQQQVVKAGITVNLITEASDSYWSDVWMVKPFFVTAWGSRTADQYLNELYRSDSPWNESYWKNPEFDKLLDAARQEPDFAKRKALYAQAQQQLWEETGTFIPYHLNVSVRVTTARVQDLTPVDPFNIRWQDVTLND